jgi:hypothetical protein
MTKAFVSLNVLDLWAEPEYNSERASQLLFAEIVTILDEQRDFCRIRQTDGYEGWADTRFLVPLPEAAAEFYLRSLNAVVTARDAHIRAGGKSGQVSPYLLFYGTRVVRRRAKERSVVVILPDSSSLLIKGSAISPIPKGRTGKVTGVQLVREAERFLGSPYLWGGIAPTGFDCSGFVRTLYGRFGVYVPRDTKDQITAGTEVKRDEIQTGDLVFFRRHVGIAIDKHRIIHSSVGGGGVRINSLQSTDADYRPDLDQDYNQARRIL